MRTRRIFSPVALSVQRFLGICPLLFLYFVGGVEDALGAAVVLFQLYDLYIVVILLEL